MVEADFLLIISSTSSSLATCSRAREQSSRQTCLSKDHSSEETTERPSARLGQSITSSTSVTSRIAILLAVLTTCGLKVVSACWSMCCRNCQRIDSAFVNLKFVTKSARSRGSYKSYARG